MLPVQEGGAIPCQPWAHPEHNTSTSHPPQGFSASSPDLELLLSKISAVNHLLSSLEKKVPTCCQLLAVLGQLLS